jgi:hypothetical protein
MTDKYQVKSIDTYLTKEWLLKKHYAKRIPSISYAFGLFTDNILVGIMTIGKPASNPLCIGVCGENYAKYVYELNRLCVNEGLEKNVLSYFLSKCFKLIKDNLIIISYADTSQGHHGYIYQATNWIYTGLSAKRTERYDIDNPNRHSKSVTENKNSNYQDLHVRERPQKHRYIYFLGKMKKEFIKSLKYDILQYPKGDNKRYDASYSPTLQTQLF